LFKRVAATEVTALCKKQTTPEDRIASDTNYFHRIQTTRNLVYASYEPHYAVAERHLIFLHICKMEPSAKQSLILCFCMSCKRYLIETALKRPQMLSPK